MLWASFGVLNILRHYIVLTLGPIFSILIATITSVGESCVLRAAASTFKGRGYYYDYLWPLDWHQMFWLIFIRQIGSWDLICVCHVCQGSGLGACIYTPSFFMSFLIRNHSLHLFLGTFSYQKDISLILLHSSEDVGEWEWSVLGVMPI